MAKPSTPHVRVGAAVEVLDGEDAVGVEEEPASESHFPKPDWQPVEQKRLVLPLRDSVSLKGGQDEGGGLPV